MDVDVVILWADRPIVHAQGRNCTDGSNHGKRTRDNGELKFLLRSIGNLPWIRNVYVVVSEGLPIWLNAASVISIPHSQIFPHWWGLPSFNSFAIEAHVHRIESLSEHFLLLNDDLVFLKQVPRSFFFPSPDKLRVCISNKFLDLDVDSEWDNSVSFAHRNANAILGPSITYRKRFWHHTKPLIKSACAEVYTTFSKEFEKMSYSPYRERTTDLSIYELAYHLLGEQRLASSSSIEFIQINELDEMKCRMVNLQDDYKDFELDFKSSLRVNPAFLCVNDDMSDEANPDVLNLYQQVMQKLFPFPSRYESS